ncbi:MAG: hypothetical protein ACI8P9_003669 [Parasphingorhabdus sp.]|jgi:uncharacterized protein (TIGR00369 family)
MTQKKFDIAAASALLEDVIAPWVQDLQLSVIAVDEAGASLRMKYSDRLCREGGIICGQSLMALADTAMVIAVAAAGDRYRPMTTVDVTTHMMKPVSNTDVIADVKILRMGRTMAFGQALLHPENDLRPAVSVTMAYALLPEKE